MISIRPSVKRLRGGLSRRRRLSPPSRAQHLAKQGRLAPPPDRTGLYHVAILYPSRAALTDALKRLLAASALLEGAADHGVSEAIYLRDPDGNGLELYRDRPEAEWPRDGDGTISMTTEFLDLGALWTKRQISHFEPGHKRYEHP